MSTFCPRCGARSEGDDDEAPEDARRAILAEEGIWALHVDVDDTLMDRVRAASALRAELGLSLPETAELKASLPSEVAKGTPVEMDDLRLRLARRTVMSRLVLVEPGTGAAERTETPLCEECTQHPVSTTCGRCGAPVCEGCRLPEYCRRCTFDVVREVLAGRRGPVGIGEAKVLCAILGHHNSDVRIDAVTIERRSAARYSPDRFFGFLAPFMVGHLLDRAGIARLDAPTVAALRAGPVPHFGSVADSVDFCAWFIPAPDSLQILLRVRSELPPAPQPIPDDGYFALPPPIPPYAAPPPTFREEASPRACPHCGKPATRFRDLGARLVCPACGRSFTAW